MGDIHGREIPDLWLFDFDRTLALLEPMVDWAGSRRALEIELRATTLPAALVDDLIAAIPRGNLVLYEALRARLLDAPAAPRVPAVAPAEARAILARASAVIERHELTGVADATPTPGALELLRALGARSRSSVVVVTSNSSITVARWLAIHRAAELVAAVVGRDSGLALKPSPAMVERALELRSHRCAIFVGDSDGDLRAARAARVPFVAVAPEAERRERLRELGARPEDLFDSPAEIGGTLGVLQGKG